MPFPVEQLIEGRRKPITVTLQHSVGDALKQMIQHDYSQLPVVDDQGRPQGIITSDSILHGLSNFGVTINQLYVKDVMSRVRSFRPENDLFELLDSLRDAYAVLIIDNDGILTGIVTDYDTADYFRGRAEDIMLIEDIERTLRDFVLAAFPDAQASQEDVRLSQAINKITALPQNQRQFKEAILEYLKLEHNGFRLNVSSLNIAYAKITEEVSKPKNFDQLSFSEYAALFFSEDRWSQYQKAFTLDKAAIRKLLEDVRQTRNKLAHFSGEVTEIERSRLRFCIEWLQRHQNAVNDAFPKTIVVTIVEGIELTDSTIVADDLSKANTNQIRFPDDEVMQPNESRYTPLALYLQKQPIATESLVLSFGQVEEILDDQLPRFARQHRSWWANDSVSHNQSQQWLDAGWRVSSVNMSEARVQFTRIGERAKAYIHFFSSLAERLRGEVDFSLKDNSPTGQSWQVFKTFPEDKQQYALLILNFGLRRRIRVELYIDCGNKERNEYYFDALYEEKEQIETAFGQALSWERLNEKQASRLAIYHDGAITETPERLNELQQWAVNAIGKFYNAIREPVNRLLAEA